MASFGLPLGVTPALLCCSYMAKQLSYPYSLTLPTNKPSILPHLCPPQHRLTTPLRQVTRNGAMGVDQAAFVGAHFGIDSKNMRKAFKDIGTTALSEDQFLSLVQKAITETRGVPADAK